MNTLVQYMDDMQAQAMERFGFKPDASDEVGPKITVTMDPGRVLPTSQLRRRELQALPLGVDTEDSGGMIKIHGMYAAKEDCGNTTISIDEEGHMRIELSFGFSITDVSLYQNKEGVELLSSNEKERNILREAVRKDIWLCLLNGPMAWPLQYLRGRKFDPDKPRRNGEFVHSSEVDHDVLDQLYFRELDTRNRVMNVFKVLTYEELKAIRGRK